MDVIPVIDLMGGEVVHARRGERGSYQPIRSGLVDGSGPLAIAGALMKLAPFRRLYVADIDAIRGGRGHDHAVAALAAAYPDLELWIDRGAADVEEARRGPGRRGRDRVRKLRGRPHARPRAEGLTGRAVARP
ncbi:HisA/HisF-related TIM barrel protein [Chenggangzhangella methanolivorans]|uniref:HisA/HisF-related TIM barrel protein n=1 Tax=Chenggangzhangella methanolivorans TaxID=1437009 RepID=UPI0021BD8A8B|nr:HisA/HisF-related TIM barrel protein [Chenggangzhangella methanolivorans]